MRKKTGTAKKGRIAGTGTAGVPDPDSILEQAEQGPDSHVGPAVDADARPAPDDDSRASQTDMERATERATGSVEGAPEPGTEEGVKGFVEPGSKSAAEHD